MNGSFYLAAIRSVSTFCLRIICAVYYADCSVIISFISCTRYKICIHKTYFISRIETFVFFRRLGHKIITFNVKLSTEWNLSGSQFLILHVVRSFQVFYLAFRIIVDHELDRIKYCHHTRTFQLQILTDTVLKHCIVNRAVGFGNTTELYEFSDGLRCESTTTKCSD